MGRTGHSPALKPPEKLRTIAEGLFDGSATGAAIPRFTGRVPYSNGFKVDFL